MEKINDTTVKIYRLYNYMGKKVVYSLEHLKGVLLRTDNKVGTMYNAKNDSYRAFIVDHNGRNYYFSNIKEI